MVHILCTTTLIIMLSFLIYDDIMIEAKGKIFRRTKAFTMYISVPSSIVRDSQFPFSRDSEEVIISIENDCLIIKKKGGKNESS